MYYRINDKGNVYRIPVDNVDLYYHIRAIGLNAEEVTLKLNEGKQYINKEEDIVITFENKGAF